MSGDSKATGGSGGSRRPASHRRRAEPDEGRLLAFDALRQAREQDAYLNLLLPRMLRERNVQRRDAAFVTDLVYGTVRFTGQLDAILARLVDRPLGQLDAPVLDVLRLGAFQILHTRIPDHAAVAATVELAHKVLGAGRSTLVNAVLRSLTRGGDLDGWLAEVTRDADPVAALAIRYSHPEWIVRAFTDALGPESGEIEQLLEADNTRPEIHLVARPGRISREDLLAQVRESGLQGRPGSLSPYSVVLEGGDPGALASVRHGSAAVQDEGSQLVAELLASAPLDGPDTAWLDLCAGPGGKAALLAAIGAERGVQLTANEPSEHRAELVRRAVGHNASVIIGDGRDGPWAEESFDRVLVDVPCSGLGALRRRPEARWRKQPRDITVLRPLQRDLLVAAAKATRPGGLIVYATCSPHRAETRTIVERAAGSCGLTLLDATAVLPELGVSGPTVQLWTHRHGTDSMFMALLQKTS